MGRRNRVLVFGVLTVVLAVISSCPLEPALYTVHFESNGGSPVSPITGLRSGDRITEPTPPSRIGYTFSGWYNEPGLMTPWDFETDVITSNHTLYAAWNAAVYTVTFDAQGGREPSPTSIDITFGSSYGDLAETTRDGYAFDGWNTELDGSGAIVTSATLVETAADHTLYAQWLMGPRPFAVDDFYEVSHDSGPTVFQVLLNDLNYSSQTGGADLAIDRVTDPDNGVVTITHDGTRIEYAPDADYVGPDTFTYTLVDTAYEGDGESTATVTVSVQ